VARRNIPKVSYDPGLRKCLKTKARIKAGPLALKYKAANLPDLEGVIAVTKLLKF
jgi:hypothetical protein